MPAWAAIAVSVAAAAWAAFALLFSMGDGGVSIRVALIGSAVAGAAAFVVTFWVTWAGWWVARHRARRPARSDDPFER